MTRVLKSSGQPPVRRGAQGSVTRLPSGSLRVKVYAGLHPVTGRPRYIGETIADGPKAREQAEEACRRLLSQVRRGRRLHSHATVNDLLTRHLAMSHVGERSRRSHVLMAAKHLRPFVGDLPLRAVTAEKLEHLYAELLRCRDHCPPRPEAGHTCRPLHRNTVRKLHYLLSSAFRRAVRWDWIDHNPAKDVELPSPPHPEPKPPTVAEAARILGEAWKDPDMGALVWLAMATGARRGELCALRWTHVDAGQGVLVVRASIAQVDGEVWEKDTKLHQRRHIALDNVTIAVLNAYHQERQQRATTVRAALTPDRFVFSPRPDGRTPRSPNAVTCQYRRMVDRLGIHTTFHKLRHYSATELIRAGVDVRTVAGRLGHAEGDTTLTYYAAWVREADQRACRILTRRLPMPVMSPANLPAPDSSPSPYPYQMIADGLRVAILDGTLLAGSILPTMKEIALRNHVCPSTAHRAIAVLVREQLVVVSRGRRAIVSDTHPHGGTADRDIAT
jgi:integrase